MDLPRDEVLEIKRAMKVANARQIALAAVNRQYNSTSYASKDDILQSDGNSKNSIVFLNLRDKCNHQAEELVALKEELREAKYEIHNLTLRCRKAEDTNRKNEVAGKALVNTLRQSLEKNERDRTNRDSLLLDDCERLLRLLNSIEKHSLHGHHLVASRTATTLLLKLRQNIDSMKCTIQQSANNVINAIAQDAPIACSNTTSPSEVMEGGPKSSVEGPSDIVLGGNALNLNINTETLDSTLLEMCRQLEDENAKQARVVSALKLELEEAQRDAAVSKLIPHYRLVIMRTRNQLTELEEQLRTEKETSQLLREQIDRMSIDLHEIGAKQEVAHRLPYTNGSVTGGSLVRGKEVHHSSPARRPNGGSGSPTLSPQNQDRLRSSESSDERGKKVRKKEKKEREGKSHRSLQRSLGPKKGSSDIKTVAGLKKIAYIMEKNISDLDAEIGLLKEELEDAALSQTQNIISGILKSVLD